MGERLVLGVDGGGTKTDVCLVTEAGEVLAFATGGGANWEGTGIDAVSTVLGGLVDEVVDRAARPREELAAAAFCLAGVDWPSDHDRLYPRVEALVAGATVTLANDAFAALAAGSTDGHGCVSIAGTGGVAAGRNRHGVTARTMGVGIGEGSGAWGLVGEALAAVAAQHHMSGEATDLTPRILALTGAASVSALFEGITRGGIAIDAELSREVLAASGDGDVVARDICRRCGAQHGRDTAGVGRRLGLAGAFEVVMAGGVHVHGEGEFRDGFAEALARWHPEAVTTVLASPPVAGAAMLALEALGVDVAAVHDTVCRGAAALRDERMRT